MKGRRRDPDTDPRARLRHLREQLDSAELTNKERNRLAGQVRSLEESLGIEPGAELEEEAAPENAEQGAADDMSSLEDEPHEGEPLPAYLEDDVDDPPPPGEEERREQEIRAKRQANLEKAWAARRAQAAERRQATEKAAPRRSRAKKTEKAAAPTIKSPAPATAPPKDPLEQPAHLGLLSETEAPEPAPPAARLVELAAQLRALQPVRLEFYVGPPRGDRVAELERVLAHIHGRLQGQLPALQSADRHGYTNAYVISQVITRIEAALASPPTGSG